MAPINVKGALYSDLEMSEVSNRRYIQRCWGVISVYFLAIIPQIWQGSTRHLPEFGKICGGITVITPNAASSNLVKTWKLFFVFSLFVFHQLIISTNYKQNTIKSFDFFLYFFFFIFHTNFREDPLYQCQFSPSYLRLPSKSSCISVNFKMSSIWASDNRSPEIPIKYKYRWDNRSWNEAEDRCINEPKENH